MSSQALPLLSAPALRATLKALYRERSEIDTAIRRLERNRQVTPSPFKAPPSPRLAAKG